MASIGEAIAGNIPVLGSVAQSVINSAQTRSNIDRQNKENRKLAEYQFSRDLEMWNKGNIYNAPQAQMQRLKDAKLNPNLVYGSGAVAGQSAGQIPKYQAPQQDYSYQPPVNIPESIGAYQDMRMNNAQVDNLKAQRNVAVQESLRKSLENNALSGDVMMEGADSSMSMIKQMKLAELQKKLTDTDVKRKMFPYQFSLLQQQNRLTEENVKKVSLQLAQITADTELKKLHADMFVPSFWAKTAIGGFNAVKGIFGKGAKGIPARINQKTSQALQPGKTASERIMPSNLRVKKAWPQGMKKSWQPYTKD